MKNKKNNEELQSRRQFFKQAAKGALPIIAATVLASAPVIVKAAEPRLSTCAGCNNRCMNDCYTTCYRTCKTHCANDCQRSCTVTCTTSCARTSKY
ncbi:MAG: Cys-Xaa-Xaa-Xaa repeat radical SAM target protein [Muribaculaceae bacterium]|nr:Cys-Xaa-Xaa-Xaa repeat radical SAM target protein [Muribaculaceae bacterium]